MKHTPEPWSVSCNRIHGAQGSGAATGIADMLGNCGVVATVDANKLRIVACVNGCAGINPEAVPALVKALRGLLESINIAIGRGDGDTFGIHHNDAMDHIADAESALAAATAEKT
jgi:hypothetical protein